VFRMSEERLERMENHIVQLIQMVAQNNKEVAELKQKFEAESELNKQRHSEVMGHIRNGSADIDYLRNQVSKHDMEIHKLNSK